MNYSSSDEAGDARTADASSGRDSALYRVLHGWPGTPATIEPKERRVQGLELLVVLSIFPLTSFYAAVSDLTERIQTGFPVVSHGIPPINGSWLAVAFGIANVIFFSAPALLVWYLLERSDGGLSAINLGERRWRMDLAYVLPVFILVQWFPQFVGAHILDALNLKGYFLIPAPYQVTRAGLTVYQVFASAQAAIVEEVVVLGYLVRRLEQRNFNVPAIVAIAVLVRVSYHLYYGWNAVPIACWALVTVLVYLRIRDVNQRAGLDRPTRSTSHQRSQKATGVAESGPRPLRRWLPN